MKWASGDSCGSRGVGVSILRSEDDGVVAGIGGREGPKLPTMAVTPGLLVADLRSRPTGAVAAESAKYVPAGQG